MEKKLSITMAKLWNSIKVRKGKRRRIQYLNENHRTQTKRV